MGDGQKPLVIVEMDTRAFLRSARRIMQKQWPKETVEAFGKIAEDAAEGVRVVTRQQFALHSDYIPKGVRSTPKTVAQKSAAERALQRHGDFEAAVYLRPSNVPQRSLEFMVHHETGDNREPHEQWIAVPLKSLRKKKGFRTGKGKVRARWKPITLLARFNQVGAPFDGKTTSNKDKVLGKRGRSRVPGNAFLIRSKKGQIMIARRTSKKKHDLEFLYVLADKVNIREQWGFVQTVRRVVKYIAAAHVKGAVLQIKG